MRRGILVALLALAVVIAFPAAASAHTYRYTVEERGDVESSVERSAEIARPTGRPETTLSKAPAMQM